MRIGRLLIGISFFVLPLCAAVQAQTPSPSPSPAPECDVPIQQADTKLRILAKPEPKFSQRDRERYRRREINLRAIFCGSGKVTNIVVTTGLTDEMDAQAIDAARLIQFTPAEKDGKKVSRPMILKYIVY
jgi:hypothetical protein